MSIERDTPGKPWPSPTHPLSADERLGELFDASYPQMVRLAHLLVGDRDAAEDLAQEAFVRLHSRLAHLSDPEAAGGYLRRIVVNLCRSHLRRRTLMQRHAGRDDVSPGADDHSLVAASRLAVLSALRTLPRRQRECLVLRYYLDLSEEEIAQTLGISPGSVKTHSARARSTMARLLGEEER
jgi:RNA polymerase sigma-70 factor (sigma-E family)